MTKSTRIGYTPEEELRAVAVAYSHVCHSRDWSEVLKGDPVYEESPERSRYYWRSAAEACAREAVRTDEPFRLEILRVATLFEQGRTLAPRENAPPRIHPLIAWAMLTRPTVWITGRPAPALHAEVFPEPLSSAIDERAPESSAVLDYRLERAILRLFERISYAEDGDPIIHPALAGTKILSADGPTFPQVLGTREGMAEDEVEVRLKKLADRGVITWDARRLTLVKPRALYKTTNKAPTADPEEREEELAKLEADLDRLLGLTPRPSNIPRRDDPTNIYRTARTGEITNERAVLERPDGDAQALRYPLVAAVGKRRASRKVPSDMTIAAWARHEYIGDKPAEIARMPHFAQYRRRAGKLSDAINNTARSLENQRATFRFP